MNSKLKIDKYSINGSLLFKILYLMLGFLNFNSIAANTTFITYCSYGVTAIGAFYFIYRLFHFDSYKKTKGIIILILFFLSYIISSLVTMKYGIVSNLKAIIWLGMQFFLLYTYDSTRTADEIKKEAIIIGWFIIGYTFILSLLSIGCLVLMYNNYNVVNGVATIIGFLWNRLWGLYSDPTYGAVVSIVSILISLFYILKYKTKVITIPLIINIITEMFYIVFSDSRTAQVSLVITFIWTAIIFVPKMNFTKSLNPFLKTIITGCIAVVVTCSLLISIKGITAFGNMYLSSVQNPNSNLFYWFDAEKRENYFSGNEFQEDTNNIEDNKNNANIIGRPIEDMGNEGGDISNRRFSIWKSAIEVFKTKALTGVSFRNIVPYTLEHLPETYIVNNNQTNFASMHNLFVDVLISQGIFGIGLFVLFIAFVLITVFKKIFKLSKQNYIFYAAILSIIVPIFISSFFYSEILYINTHGSVIFWIVLGYLMNLSDKLQEEKICVK